MKKVTTRALVAAIALAPLTATAITPVAAYDRDLYGYAASHMIERSDIPKVLGDLSDNLDFFANAARPTTRIFGCGLADKQVGLKVDASNFSGSYSTEFDRKAGQDAVYKSVQVSVYHFKTASAAAKAYSKLETRAKKCTGTSTVTSPGAVDENGVPEPSYTSTTTLRNGQTSIDISDGRRGVYIESDFLGGSQTPDGQDSKFFSDNLAIYALADNVIVQTQFNSNERSRITKAEKAAVEQLAVTAVQTWRG